tara:strand:- start:130 stop:513 length:384 start_codon:yes stop_codon:yes gene_type:complete
MGRVRSLRIEGSSSGAVDTDVIGSQGAVLHQIIVNVIDIATGVMGHGGAPFEVRAYEDTTGSGTTNLIWRKDFGYTNGYDGDPNSTDGQDTNYFSQSFGDGIYCKSGLRIEIDRLTVANLEVFVLYS